MEDAGDIEGPTAEDAEDEYRVGLLEAADELAKSIEGGTHSMEVRVCYAKTGVYASLVAASFGDGDIALARVSLDAGASALSALRALARRVLAEHSGARFPRLSGALRSC